MSAAVRAGYKQTDVGVIPEDWEVVALGEIASTSSGTTPARDLADRYYRNGTVHWVKTLDLNNSDLADTDEQVTLTAVDETSLRPYPVGTVLVAMYGGFNQIGRTGLLRIPAAVNQAITAIQPRATKLQPEYLLATLNFRVDYWKTVASSSRKDPNITSQDVRAFPIAFPQLPEQRAIATALSDVDALLAKLDALVAKKRDLKVAAMQQLLTGQTRLPGFSGEWEVKRLGELFAFSGGHTASRDQLSDNGYCYLHYGDIHLSKKTFIDVEAEFLEIPKLVVALNDVSTASILKDGDVVFVDASEDDEGTSKHIVVVNQDDRTYISGLHTIVAKSKANRIDNLFKRYCFQTRSIKEQFRFFAVGTKVSGISKTSVAKVKLHFPPSLEEQTAIATVLSDMDTELSALKARRDKTRALKQGMMQELLTGRIRLV